MDNRKKNETYPLWVAAIEIASAKKKREKRVTRKKYHETKVRGNPPGTSTNEKQTVKTSWEVNKPRHTEKQKQVEIQKKNLINHTDRGGGTKMVDGVDGKSWKTRFYGRETSEHRGATAKSKIWEDICLKREGEKNFLLEKGKALDKKSNLGPGGTAGKWDRSEFIKIGNESFRHPKEKHFF